MKALLANRWVLLLCRLLLGGVFVAASVSKILDLEAFADTVAGYGLLPDGIARAYGWVVPWVELYVGCSLLLGALPRLAAGLSIPLTLSFVVASSWALVKLPDSICGCFGNFIILSHPVSLTINAAMLAMAAVVVTGRQPEFFCFGALLDGVNPYWKQRVKARYYSSLLTVVVLTMGGAALVAVGVRAVNPASLAASTQIERSISIPAPFTDMVSAPLEQKKPVMLYVFYEGCVPCREAKPVIEALVREYNQRISYVSIDYGLHPGVVTAMEVRSTPTVLLIVRQTADGDFGVLRTFTGKVERRPLKAALDAAIRFVQ